MKKHLMETDSDLETQKSFEQKFEQETLVFKAQAISNLIEQTPQAFKPGLEFDDWPTAMAHLQKHKEEALRFWRFIQ